MNYFPLFRESHILKKAMSVLALVALVAGGISGLAYTTIVHANHQINSVSAVLSSGPAGTTPVTLTAGQFMEVHFNEPMATSTWSVGACTVNDVDVAGTFDNVSVGHYKVTYMVGSGDADRAAGTVPINCTISEVDEAGTFTTVTLTGFDDGNMIAIDATPAASDTGTTTAPTAPTISAVSIAPSSGILTAGDSVVVSFLAGANDTDLAVSGLCHVNAVDVSSSFENVGGGLYTFDNTVGANDGERPAGNIPIS